MSNTEAPVAPTTKDPEIAKAVDPVAAELLAKAKGAVKLPLTREDFAFLLAVMNQHTFSGGEARRAVRIMDALESLLQPPKV
jgi:metal-dependent amidase/aminoacylase/carboxypeptidase family protein